MSCFPSAILLHSAFALSYLRSISLLGSSFLCRLLQPICLVCPLSLTWAGLAEINTFLCYLFKQYLSSKMQMLSGTSVDPLWLTNGSCSVFFSLCVWEWETSWSVIFGKANKNTLYTQQGLVMLLVYRASFTFIPPEVLRIHLQIKRFLLINWIWASHILKA